MKKLILILFVFVTSWNINAQKQQTISNDSITNIILYQTKIIEENVFAKLKASNTELLNIVNQNNELIRNYQLQIDAFNLKLDTINYKYETIVRKQSDDLELLKASNKDLNSKIDLNSRKLSTLTNGLENANDNLAIVETKNIELESNSEKLNSKILSNKSELNDKTTEIGIIKDSISKKQLLWFSFFLILILAMFFLYIILNRKRTSDKLLLLKKHNEIFEKQIEDSQKLAEWLELESTTRLKAEVNASGEIDHSFPKRVADEIVKFNGNLARMDEKIKGYKHLKKSIEKLEKSLNANGYEILEMLNKPYHEGMNVVASFIPDDTLEEDVQKITRIIKPHVNFKGKMIQAAQIEVSQGV